MYRAPSEVADHGFSAASPTPTLSSSGGGGHAGSIYSTTSAPNLSTKSRALSQSTAKRTKQSETRAKPPTGRVKASDAKAKPSGKGKTSVSTRTRKTPTSVSSNNTPSASRDVTTGGYYRHDYDGSMPKVLDSHHSPGSPAHSHSPLPEPRVFNSTATSSTVGGSATGKILKTVMKTIDIYLTRRHGYGSETCPPTASHGDTSHPRLTEWNRRPPVGRSKNTSQTRR
jgi:hypothetical protein